MKAHIKISGKNSFMITFDDLINRYNLLKDDK